jgi:hypothetical protein
MENINDTFIEMVNTKVIVTFLNNDKDAKLIPCEEFRLKLADGIMPYLHLEDISKQVIKWFGKGVIIDVWQELGLNGYIYRYGNHGEFWEEHGRTKGYA